MTAKIRTTTLSTLTFATVLLSSGLARAQDSESSPTPPITEGAEGQGGDAEATKEQDDSGDKGEEAKDERNERLADRIKSVQRKPFLKRERVEIYPYFGLDLNDPFFQHLLVGGSISYHIVDSLAIEARGGGAIARIKQRSVNIVREQLGAVPENAPEFKYHADLDFNWAPFYGKISLLGEGILHFDTYLTAGPGIFGTDAGLNPAANIGIGQRYYISKWLTARIELRDYLFIDNREDQSSLENLLVFGLSVSIFFPTSFEYDFQ